MQKTLIRLFLEPLARFMERFSQKTRDAAFVIACLVIFLQFFVRGTGFFQYRYLWVFALGSLCLAVMLLCTLRVGLMPVRFRKKLLLPWFGVGGLMLLSGVLYSPDYLPEAMQLLVAYPLIYLVWSQVDTKKLFHLLFKTVKISFIIYLAVSLTLFPVTDVRYSGLFSNLNGAAGYLALVAVCLITECLWEEKLTGALIGRFVLLGICLALLLYTSSRTGLLEVIVALVALIAMGFIRYRKRLCKALLRNIGLLAVSVVLFFNVSLYVFQFGYAATNYAARFVAQQVCGEEFAWDGFFTLPVIHPQDSADLTADRLNMGNQSLENISTGRSAIWTGYLKQLNLFGHPDSGTVGIQRGGVDKTYHTTHMTILQIAYENGTIAGLLYLVFNLLAGACSVKYALRRRDDPYAMVPLAISLAYGVFSLFASTGISFWYMTTFCYYLVQFPLMVKPASEAENSGHTAS